MRKTPIPKVAIFGDTTPYENPLSMIAYRISLVSIIPMIGWPFGLIGLILGYIALQRYKKNTDIDGRSQATAAMFVGIISFVLQSAGLYCLGRGREWWG